MNFQDWYNNKFGPISGQSSAQDVMRKAFMREAWNAGWQKGYDQGKDDPYFENDDEEDTQ